MAVNSVLPPYPLFADATGQPLENGFIYIGQPGFEARSNPKASFFDVALTIPTGTASGAAIRTKGGFPINNSRAPAMFYVDGDFSTSICDRNGVLLYSALNTTLALDVGAAVGPVLAADGNLGAVGLGFVSEADTGWVRSATGTVQYVVQGSVVAQMTATGVVFNQTVGGAGFAAGLSAAMVAAPGTYRGNLGLGAMALATQTVITEANGIANNDNDTTVPTSAAVNELAETLQVGGNGLNMWREEWIAGSSIVATNMLSSAAIASGTIVAPTIPAASTAPPWTGAGTTFRSSTTTNSGYRITFPTILYESDGNIRFRARMGLENGGATGTARIGFHNSTTSTAPTRGVYFEIGADLKAAVANSFGVTIAGTTASYSAADFLIFDISYRPQSGGTAVFSVLKCARVGDAWTASSILSETMALGVFNSGDSFAPTIVATHPSTTAQNLWAVYSVGYGVKRV